MSKFGTIALWVVRKALYVSVGTVLAVLSANYAHVDPANLEAVKWAGVIAGLGAALIGDLRRAFAADFLQIISGQDPRVDG